MDIPSLDLGHALVPWLCSSSSASPLLWSYLDYAMASRLASSFHILALLLSSRLIPNRFLDPENYSLCLEVVGTHIFSIGSTKAMPSCHKVVKVVDVALQLSESFGVTIADLGSMVVHFILVLVQKLVDATFEDWGVYMGRSDKRDQVYQYQALHDTSLQPKEGSDEKRGGTRERLCQTNTITAIDIATKTANHKVTRSLLRLARRNLLNQWGLFTHCLRSLEGLASDTAVTAPKGMMDSLMRLLGSMQQFFHEDVKLNQVHDIGVGTSATWVPIDIFMEDAMDTRRILSSSMVDMLANLVRSLQAVQKASWHETFLALWLSALRLVQREQNLMEGPRPMSEIRVSVLLAIVPLTSALLIEEEEKQSTGGAPKLDSSSVVEGAERGLRSVGNRHTAFVASVQTLGQFEGLLSPNQHENAAAQAAGTAAAFLAGFKDGSTPIEAYGAADRSSSRTVASLRHLIVETCIARGLLDTSAYYWPGYVGNLMGNIPVSASPQVSPWHAYMEGAPLMGSLKNSLMITPARSLPELKKIYQAAVDGSDSERPAAASVLSGASLILGWNVQEHVIQYILQLLSPVHSPDANKNTHYLVPHAPVLHAVLTAISSNDALQILSLYGMFPDLAAALLPICEVFGSLSPLVPLVIGSGDEVSALSLFSLAFLILTKLWKFHRPPVEHRLLGKGAPLGSESSLGYLLMRHNMQVSSTMRGTSLETVEGGDDHVMGGKILISSNSSLKSSGDTRVRSGSQHVTMDSFAKLKEWYLQHQSCIASPLSGLACGDPVHQVVDKLLAMVMRRVSKGGTVPVTPNTSTTNANSDDIGGKVLLPAWDLLTAVPFVVDALLTACEHGRLSPRDLTTGLRDLVEFFPASLASVVSYLAAEVTRGLWKPALMNGKDWPNPSANLSVVETELHDMLAAIGIDVPSSVPGNVVVLPLPLAALVSLTITFKVEKNTEVILAVSGLALQSAAAGSPWPITPIVAALWAQKVPRWHDFIVFSSSQTIFKQNKDSVVQLLRSCFAFFLGTSPSLFKLTVHGGVAALLGHGNWIRAVLGGKYPVPPGLLFLRICPCLHDCLFLPEEILALLVNSLQKLDCGSSFTVGQKNGSRLRSLQPSLAGSHSKIIQASSLAASLLFVSGGTTLAQLLYTETLPTWFLSGQRSKGKSERAKHGSDILLEGYAMAYFAIFSGAFAWGMTDLNEQSTAPSKKQHAIGTHMAFLAAALDGKVSLACEPSTWKAYVEGFVSLVIACTSNWVLDIRVDILKSIAAALRMWHEYDLAAALLEKGGLTTMSVAAEIALAGG